MRSGNGFGFEGRPGEMGLRGPGLPKPIGKPLLRWPLWLSRVDSGSESIGDAARRAPGHSKVGAAQNAVMELPGH